MDSNQLDTTEAEPGRPVGSAVMDPATLPAGVAATSVALLDALSDDSLLEAMQCVARLAKGQVEVWSLTGERLFSTGGAASEAPVESERCDVLLHGEPAAFLTLSGENAEGMEDARQAALQILRGHLRLESQNGELTDEVLGKLKELSALYHVAETLAVATGSEEVADVLLASACEVVEPAWACVISHDLERGQLRVAASTSTDGRPARPWRPVDANSLAWQVMNEGQAMLLPELNSTERRLLEHDVGCVAKDAGSALIAPMRSGGTPFGALILLREDEGPSFTSIDLKLVTALGLQGAVSTGHLRLYQQSREMFLATVWALASAIDAKDSYTHGHSQRVARYSAALAAAVGYDEAAVARLELSAVLHDVGKIGVPEAILNKEGRLTAAEMAIMRTHPEKGATILGSIRAMRDVVPGVLHHHERYDGLGYPDGLKGEAIPHVARIILIADTFDAMTSTRPYREGLPLEVALEELRRCSGTQFDPNLVEAFLGLFERGELRVLQDDCAALPAGKPGEK